MTRFVPVVDTTRSLHARLKPHSLAQITLRDEFWQPRRLRNRQHTLKSQAELIESTNRLANFRRAAGTESGAHEGFFFNDSDVYKWLEALASTLAEPFVDEAPTALRALLDSASRDIAGAQEPDGYLMTYFTLHRAGVHPDRWEGLHTYHQLYCMGHFLQAAVAAYRATGDELLLDTARRVGDCLDETFGPDKPPHIDGHPEIEMAMVELFRATGEPRYLKLAQSFVDARGQRTVDNPAAMQSFRGVREQKRLEGHAVCALYLAVGVTDLALETGEPALWQALDAQWDNLTNRQLYLTGGAGSRWAGEAFGRDFQLPNERAYAETCAAIALVMWAWRMAQRDGDARFVDTLERALYNGVLSGLSLGGDEYFYQNPLADDGTHRRAKWFGCACCPPNIARLLAQMPGYFYSQSGDEIWAHLFAQSTATFSLTGNRVVEIEQQTAYPWNGEVVFRVAFVDETDGKFNGEWTLHIRIPNWARDATLRVGEQDFPAIPGTYAAVRRAWKPGDEIRLTLPMPVEKIRSHPHVVENSGRVALMRGPLVYCGEACDHLGADAFDWRDVEIAPDAAFEPEHRADLLGGATILKGEAEVVSPRQTALYGFVDEAPEVARRAISLRLIPYCVWANRDAGPMQVWLKCE